MAGNGNGNGNAAFVAAVAEDTGKEIKSVKQAMVEGTLAILRGDYLTYSLRQIYYRLVAVYGLVNKQASYKTLSDALARARENGKIPWNRMEDRTRSIIFNYPSEDDTISETTFLDRIKYAIQREIEIEAYSNKWDGQRYLMTAAVEKDSLIGVVQEVARYRTVTACAFKGYSSVDHLNNLIEKWNILDPTGSKAVVIVYGGDFDPEGRDIPRAAIKWLRDKSGRDIYYHRIALRKTQILKMDLPSGFVKASSSRAASWTARHGTDVWELDAIPPRDLVQMYMEAVDLYYDRQIARRVEAEKEERTRILRRQATDKLISELQEAKDFLENDIENYLFEEYGINVEDEDE